MNTEQLLSTMYQLNRVTLIGRLTADPQVKTIKSGGTMVLCGVATNYSYKDAQGNRQQGVDYHRIVAFGRLAEQIASSLKKGQRAFIEGRQRTRTWNDDSGQQRFITEVLARTCIFMDVKVSAEEESTEAVSPEALDAAVTDEMPAEVNEVQLW